MKPPSRTRTKPNRDLNHEEVTLSQCAGKVVYKWRRVEQRKLLKALKSLSRITGGRRDIDYAFLRKYVATRSISEIHGMVEFLRDKVISLASVKFKKKRWEEKTVIKPIEVWAHMASTMAGTLEESISTAFSQMLIVSSTEPCTLRNSDPPQVHRPSTDEDRPIGRTIPLRPMPRLPVQGECPSTAPLALKTPMPSFGTAKRILEPFQVVSVTNSEDPPQQWPSSTTERSPAATSHQLGTTENIIVPSTSPQSGSQIVKPGTGHATPSCGSAALEETQRNGTSVIQITQQLTEQQPTSLCTSWSFNSTSSNPQMPLCSLATNPTPVFSTAPSCVASSSSATSTCSSTHPVPPLCTPTTELHAMFGRTSKYATKDSPRTFGLKCVVDFERLYRYLSFINKPNMDCYLTPMESAIILDLLLSLPEEISLLDCNKLHKYLLQVYQCLSSPADSRIAREMFKELRDGLSAQTEPQRGGSSSRNDPQEHTARTPGSSDVADAGEKKQQPSRAEHQGASESSNTCLSGDADTMELCPLLNPFMVPLKLLMRR